jgi:hypothetical protein
MRRELDTRINAEGNRISLLWLPSLDRIEIAVEDRELGAVRRAAIPPDRARDAFEHPFLYLPAEALELVAA